jgi:GMP synthase-like glutamine amidotransferase
MAETKNSRTVRPYRVLVVGGGYDYIKLLFDLGYQGATGPKEADIVLFTGGEDVDPVWYGEKKLQPTFSNIDRDRREKVIYDYCIEAGVPMVGICRGGQFLNVMNGGKMWQDVEGHLGNHGLTEVLSPKSKREPRTILATSTHHQMMRPTNEAAVIAVGTDHHGDPVCDQRCSFDLTVKGKNGKKHPDYEILWYEDTKCLCFQPHPEFPNAPKQLKEYFDELLDNLVLPVA